jgi:hypothetical protein
MGGGGTQPPVWHVNGPKKMGARSARPRTRGQNPLIPLLLESCGLFSERLLTLFPINYHFWPRSLRFEGCYSQKCSLFSQKQINALVYLALYLTWNNSAQFGNCRPLTFWKWCKPFSWISAPICFPVFSYPFLDRFFHLQHADFNGEHLS